MQIEQPAELNRYVDSSIPLTWAIRWEALKVVLPLLMCCSVILIEGVIFRLWLNDQSLISELPRLFLGGDGRIGSAGQGFSPGQKNDQA